MNEEFKNLFYDMLPLNMISFDAQSKFLISMNSYLDHGRTNKINGRTLEYVAARLNKLFEFLNTIGLGKFEAIVILSSAPEILNSIDDLYDKYIFLGCLEGQNNMYRKTRLLGRPADFRTSLNKMYARYKLIKEAGYKLSWNVLVHASDNEFCDLFVQKTYAKPYQIFTSKEEVMDYLANVDINELNLEEFKQLPVNEEIVQNYEKGRKR